MYSFSLGKKLKVNHSGPFPSLPASFLMLMCPYFLTDFEGKKNQTRKVHIQAIGCLSPFKTRISPQQPDLPATGTPDFTQTAADCTNTNK